MRSKLVFGALAHVSNRFLLAKVVAKATRKFHRPNTRIQETMDEVLARVGQANPLAVVQATNNLQPLRSAKKAEKNLRYSYEDRSVA